MINDNDDDTNKNMMNQVVFRDVLSKDFEKNPTSKKLRDS